MEEKDLRLYFLDRGVFKKFGRGKTGRYPHLFKSYQELELFFKNFEVTNPRMYRVHLNHQIFVVDYKLLGPYGQERVTRVIRLLPGEVVEQVLTHTT